MVLRRGAGAGGGRGGVAQGCWALWAMFVLGVSGCNAFDAPASESGGDARAFGDFGPSAAGHGGGVSDGAALDPCSRFECSARCTAGCGVTMPSPPPPGNVICAGETCADPLAPVRALGIGLPSLCCTAERQCGLLQGGACVAEGAADPRCPQVGDGLPLGLTATPCCVEDRCGLLVPGTTCLSLEELADTAQVLGAIADLPEPRACGAVLDDAGAHAEDGDDGGVILLD